jgi:hypothetical protein
MTGSTDLSCICGGVRLRVDAAPIASVECYCNSCRAAGGRLQGLAGAPAILGAHGGTHFVLYRKDRVHFIQGNQALRELRLSGKATTRRVVATCCNTPVFLEFHNGHWLSLYGQLWPADQLPALELRTMTSDLDDPTALPRDVTNARWQSLSFYYRLFMAWAAMGFKSPKVAANGALHISAGTPASF